LTFPIDVNGAGLRINNPDFAESIAKVKLDLLFDFDRQIVRLNDFNNDVGGDFDIAHGNLLTGQTPAGDEGHIATAASRFMAEAAVSRFRAKGVTGAMLFGEDFKSSDNS
jgi:hypothetical protein